MSSKSLQRIVFISFLFLTLCFINVRAENNGATLQNCSDDKLHVKFLCDPDWGLMEEDDTMLLVISDDPAVTMTIVKISSGIKFLEQISVSDLENIGQYAEGFQKEIVTIGKNKAVQVKAVSDQFPEMRLQDYYFLRDDRLYGVLFSVDPKDDWGQFYPLIEKIINSFDFIDGDSGVPGTDLKQYLK